MATAHSKNSRVLANTSAVSGWIRGYSLGHTRDMSEVTVVTDGGTRWLPGLLGGSLKLDGVFDTAAGSLYQVAVAAKGVDNGLLVTVAPDGTALGSPAFFTVTDLSGLDVQSSVKDAVMVSVEGTPDDGVDWGVVLHAHQAETTTGNGTGQDNTVSSSNGGVGVLHVTAYSGLTNIAVKVQHSPDNSTWSDLITFTTATAVTSERKTATGTVNRYTRAIWTATGVGSATFLVAFARR